MLIAVEGIDGAGKTTLIARLHAAFEARGRTVRVVRRYMLDEITELWWRLVDADLVDQLETAQLAAADYAIGVRRIIEPALARGEIVLADKYVYSHLVYFTLRDLPRATLDTLFAEPLEPAHVLWLRLDAELALDRLRATDGKPDLLEAGLDHRLGTSIGAAFAEHGLGGAPAELRERHFLAHHARTDELFAALLPPRPHDRARRAPGSRGARRGRAGAARRRRAGAAERARGDRAQPPRAPPARRCRGDRLGRRGRLGGGRGARGPRAAPARRRRARRRAARGAAARDARRAAPARARSRARAPRSCATSPDELGARPVAIRVYPRLEPALVGALYARQPKIPRGRHVAAGGGATAAARPPRCSSRATRRPTPSLTERLYALKGPSSALEPAPGSLRERFGRTSSLHAVLHVPDDLRALVLEASLFFSWAQLRAAAGAAPIDLDLVERLVTLEPLPGRIVFAAVVKVKLRILAAVAVAAGRRGRRRALGPHDRAADERPRRPRVPRPARDDARVRRATSAPRSRRRSTRSPRSPRPCRLLEASWLLSGHEPCGDGAIEHLFAELDAGGVPLSASQRSLLATALSTDLHPAARVAGERLWPLGPDPAA